MPPHNQRRTLLDWLGLKDPRAYPPAFGHFLGFLLTLILLSFAVLFLMAFAASIFLVFGVFTDAGSSLGVSALLVALLGAPFLIWRTLVAQRTLDETKRQTDLQDEAAFNDKINAAAKDLAARRQVTKIVQQDSKDVVLTEWEDDLVTRAAAIDRLEGLALEAMERGDFAPAQRIARMLSIYVQELSREYPARAEPKNASADEFDKWVRTLRPARSDMERAVQSLGRINPRNECDRLIFNSKNIDLSKCNLQGFNLRDLNLRGTTIAQSSLQRVDAFGLVLRNAHAPLTNFSGATLIDARFDESFLMGCHFRSANGVRLNFSGAKLVLCNFVDCTMREGIFNFCDASNIKIDGGDFSKVQFIGSNLNFLKLQGDPNISGTTFFGSAIQFPNVTTLMALFDHWETFFSDGSASQTATQVIEQKGGGRWPPSWPQEKLDNRPGSFDDTPFIAAWRAWADTLDPPITIAPDYDRD